MVYRLGGYLKKQNVKSRQKMVVKALSRMSNVLSWDHLSQIS